MKNSNSAPDLIAWWIGPCGALHVETNPVVLGGCPDGFENTSWMEEDDDG